MNVCVCVCCSTRRQYFSTSYHFLVSLSLPPSLPPSLSLTADGVPTLNASLVTDELVLLTWSPPPLANLSDHISEDDLPRRESIVMVIGYNLTRRNDPTKTLNFTDYLDNNVNAGDSYFYDLDVLYSDSRIRDNIPVGVELEVEVPSSIGKQQMHRTQ